MTGCTAFNLLNITDCGERMNVLGFFVCWIFLLVSHMRCCWTMTSLAVNTKYNRLLIHFIYSIAVFVSHARSFYKRTMALKTSYRYYSIKTNMICWIIRAIYPAVPHYRITDWQLISIGALPIQKTLCFSTRSNH